jgi:predicted amidohydrolase
VRIALPRIRNTGIRASRRLDELAAVVNELTRAAEVDVIVFPELFACGYPAHEDAVADRAVVQEVSESLTEGPSAIVASALASASGCAIVYGISERDGDHHYNTVVLADADGAISGYRKIHLTPAESTLWDRGETAVVADARIGGVTVPVGLSACYDKAFPQVYERQRERGARVSLISSAWSSSVADDAPDDLWAMQSALFDRARAAETGMAVVSTNYEGPKVPGAHTRFCGGARVVDGLGRELRPVRVVGATPLWELDLDADRRAVNAVNGGDFFLRDRRTVR